MHETLEPEVVRRFREDIRSLERHLMGLLGDQTSCCGVSMAQCHCLLEVERRGEPTVRELATALEVDTSTMSRNLDGMVTLGLVDRSANPRDRRSVVVRLSPQGQKVVQTINNTNDRLFGSLLAGLTPPEREHVLEGIRVLARSLPGVRGSEEGCCGEK